MYYFYECLQLLAGQLLRACPYPYNNNHNNNMFKQDDHFSYKTAINMGPEWMRLVKAFVNVI